MEKESDVCECGHARREHYCNRACDGKADQKWGSWCHARNLRRAAQGAATMIHLRFFANPACRLMGKTVPMPYFMTMEDAKITCPDCQQVNEESRVPGFWTEKAAILNELTYKLIKDAQGEKQ